jgi:hypothetical protein
VVSGPGRVQAGARGAERDSARGVVHQLDEVRADASARARSASRSGVNFQRFQRGASLQEVKDLLGHKTLAMTLRYAHLAPERLRAAVATLDGILVSPREAVLPPQDAAPIADGRKVGARESTPRELERLAVS